MSRDGLPKEDEVAERLQKHGVSIDKWGEGAAKTFEHLLSELQSGESKLESQSTELLRKFKVVGVEVIYQDENGQTFRLKEDRQVFNNGRERKRQLETSLAEKIKPGEEPDAAARRAISEELGIENVSQLQVKGQYHVRKLSESFPGLTSDYNAFMYEVMLDSSQFSPEGYIETQSDKKTYFVWEKSNTQPENY